uniref:Uncharacterized protein n=1 Tax=Leersia perrieri TaxID=77586 RepID=A0A0D9UY55_9ORYZ
MTRIRSRQGCLLGNYLLAHFTDIHHLVPIHKSKTHSISSDKISVKQQDLRIFRSNTREFNLGTDAETSFGIFIGVININPHEPSILHVLEDQESSLSGNPQEVNMIKDEGRVQWLSTQPGEHHPNK